MILTAAVLLCLVAGATYYYRTVILISPLDSDDIIARKLQKMLLSDNPENPPPTVSCQTLFGNKQITVLCGDRNIYQVQKLKKLGKIKCSIDIHCKIKEIPDLSGTGIESLNIITAQDFAINFDLFAAMPNIKSFSVVLPPNKLMLPTKNNENIVSMAINSSVDGSFNPAILSRFPNLKSFVLGSFSATTDVTDTAAKLPETLDYIVVFGKIKNYLNLVKACPKVNRIVFEEGNFDLAGLEKSAPALTSLSFIDCTIGNPQVLQQLPLLSSIVFRGFSPQEVENMTRNLPPKVKVTLGQSRKTAVDGKQ